MTAPTLSKTGWTYYSLVVTAGLTALAWAATDLAAHSALIDRGLLFLLAFTVLGVFATIQVPALPVTLSVAEAFFFMIVLLYGTGAGTFAVALEALVVWWRLLRRGNPATKIIFTLCANSLAIAVAGKLFYLLADVEPLAGGGFDKSQVASLITPTLTLALAYFSISSSLVAVAIAFERQAAPLRVWADNFSWLSLNYLAASSLALLFVVYVPLDNPVFLLVIGPPILLLYLTYATSSKRVQDAKNHLDRLNTLYLATIETLATAIDAKDQVTHGHIRRVQQLAVTLARALGVHGQEDIKAIEAASLLHDMGKLAVPDYILNKPGPLSSAEFEKMKLHASVGADILSAVNFPYPVVPIVRHHHENWDGTGYPDALRGDAIPIGARILAVVDCFDALTSDRPYRPRLSDEAAFRIVSERRGRMYDPAIVDAFLALRPQLVGPVAPQAVPEGLNAIAEAAQRHDGVQSVGRLDQIAASSEEMLTLYELGRAVGGELGFAEVAAVVAQHLRRLIPATSCVFFPYDDKTDELYVAHVAGEFAGFFTGIRIPLGQRLSGWVAANRQTIVNSDPVLDLGEVARVIQPPLRSCLSAPLIARGTLVGTITLYSTTKDAFNEEHRRILEAVGGQIAAPLRNGLEFDRHKTDWKRHPTELPSAEPAQLVTHYEDILEPEASSIVIVHVNSLRSITSRLGPQGADDIVRRVGLRVRQEMRDNELIFRSTTDDYVVLLPRTSRSTAEQRALSVQQSVHDAEIEIAGFHSHVSVTIAVASVPLDGRSVEQALAAAQRRLRASVPPEDSVGSNRAVH